MSIQEQIHMDYHTLCELLGEDPQVIKTHSRKLEVVSKRQIIQWVMYNHSDKYTQVIIGAFFNGQDHSTVINSIRKVEEHKPYYQEAMHLYNKLVALKKTYELLNEAI